MPKIKEWSASYFIAKSRSWVYGKLQLYSKFIRFIGDNSGANRNELVVPYDKFMSVKRQTTWTFYGAIVVRAGDQYWFSSFSDRDSVYFAIEHFWKEMLFTSSTTAQAGPSSPKNKELFDLLHDSQKTLTNVARTVHDQGQQIRGACTTMNTLHNQLDIAENLIGQLQPWLDKWKADIPKVKINPLSSSLDTSKVEYPILYSMLSPHQKSCQGVLVITKESINVLDVKRVNAISFQVQDITSVLISTPWECTFCKSIIGQPDKKVHVTSTRLAYILSQLEHLLWDKYVYEDTPDVVDDEREVLMSCANAIQGPGDQNLSKNLNVTDDAIGGFSQLMYTEQCLTYTEAAEMSHMLGSMKTMALGIQEETQTQLDNLDDLGESVDKAADRLRNNIRQVKKIT